MDHYCELCDMTLTPKRQNQSPEYQELLINTNSSENNYNTFCLTPNIHFKHNGGTEHNSNNNNSNTLKNNICNSNVSDLSNNSKTLVFNDNIDNNNNIQNQNDSIHKKNNIRQNIGPYKVLKPLGRGTFSEVVLVTNRCEFYACKIISKKKLVGHEDAFENEIRIHQKMHHPNIVELIDLLMDDENYYMILEYCSRGDLCDFLSRNGGISECVARHVIGQLMSAVSHVHQLSVAHRDIKPENVLMDALWNVKLSDFGLSDFAKDGVEMTKSCGSVLYASPECLSGCPYDGARTDAWSCGVTAYAVLAGQTPWRNDNRTADEEAVKMEILTSEIRLPKSFSPKFKDFVTKLLTKDWHSRMTVVEALKHPWLAEADSARGQQCKHNQNQIQQNHQNQNYQNYQNQNNLNQNHQNNLNQNHQIQQSHQNQNQNHQNQNQNQNNQNYQNQNQNDQNQNQQNQQNVQIMQTCTATARNGARLPSRRHTMEMGKSLVTDEKLASFIENMKEAEMRRKMTLSCANSVIDYKAMQNQEGGGATAEANGEINDINIAGRVQESCLKRFIKEDGITDVIREKAMELR